MPQRHKGDKEVKLHTTLLWVEETASCWVFSSLGKEPLISNG